MQYFCVFITRKLQNDPNFYNRVAKWKLPEQERMPSFLGDSGSILYSLHGECHVFGCVCSGNMSNQSPAVVDDNNKLPAGMWKTGRGAGQQTGDLGSMPHNRKFRGKQTVLSDSLF